MVDDDEDDREIFQHALETLNCTAQLVCAFNGINALEQIAHPDFMLPDLIILDLNMPRMTGRQLLAQLRQRAEYRHIPVIIYTTSSSPADYRELMEMGATAFMTKHTSMARMCADLGQLLGQYQIAVNF